MSRSQVRSRAELFLTRSMSGFIYALITIACLALGPIPTTILIICEAWLCCSEFFRMVRMAGRVPNETFGLLFSLLFPVAAHFYGLAGLMLLTILLICVCVCWFVLAPRANIADVAVTAFGPLYTSLMLSSIVLLRLQSDFVTSGYMAFLAMFSIGANDSFAYLIGSAIGRHKLVPKISPNKSWEGFIAGLLASLISWVLFAVFHLVPLHPAIAAWAGLFVALMAVVGDLFESRLKRGVGVKDSGNLIPGHGGLLDRNDSMIFGCMAAYLVFFLTGGGLC